MPSIYNIPDEILYHIYKEEFSALGALRQVDKQHEGVCNTIAKKIAEQILKDSASEETSLYRFVRQFTTQTFDTFAKYSSFFHQVAQKAQAFGGSIPERAALPILSPEEMRNVSTRIEDEALELIWPGLRKAIYEVNPALVIFNTKILNPENFKACDIREWLKIHPVPLANVTQLTLRCISMKILPPEIGYFTALQELDLSSNKLSVLPPEIGQLTSLRKLELQFNQLETLPSEIVQLTALQELNLESNQFTTIPSEIGSLTALQKLNFVTNQIKALIPEIGQLTQLRVLKLENNQLSAIPAEIVHLWANLQELSLDNNQFTAIPPQIFQLIALQKLILSHNQIAVLPQEIGQLTALVVLGLGNNELTTLPSQIWQLTALEYLLLDNNELTTLPSQIGQLTALQHLYLNNTQLTALPSEIGQLTALQHLELNHNYLSALPSEINRLPLERISLSHNEFMVFPLLTGASPPVSEIRFIPSLTMLNLSGNKLKSLPPEISQLSNLKILNLSDNQLTTLPSELGQLQLIFDLNLKNNPIFPLPFFLFQIHRTQGSVADLYALCSETPVDLSQVSTAISSLPAILKDGKNGLYYWIWETSGKPATDDAEWGENHALDNFNVLKEAVFRSVKALFASCNQEFQNKCFEYIYRLAGSPATEDLQWGEHHAYDDPLRFLGAVDLMRKRVVLL